MTDTVLKRRPFLLGAGAAGLLATGSSMALAQTRRATGIALPVTGIASTGQQVLGTFTPSAAVVQNGQLFLQGLLQLAGGVTQQVLMPVANAVQSTCTILDLQLGPLDLNLLGLRIQLDQVNLLITAQRGGGLLGDLLCAIAGLLSGGSPLTAIAGLLTQLLRAFG